MRKRVACVTGANKGIGLEIAKKLALNDFIVIMACRNSSAAKQGESEIIKKVNHAHVEHVQFDLDDPQTAEKAAEKIRKLFPEGIDVLINNAGFAYNFDETKPFHQQAVDSIRRNYFGTVSLCEALSPMIRDGGRMINVSSMAGSLSNISSSALATRWRECKTREDIEKLLEEFIELTKINGKHLEAGWPNSAYGVSKLALTSYTRVFGGGSSRFHVFSCCPGACQTEMSSFSGYKTAEEGADTPVWLSISGEALEQIPQGAFVSDRIPQNA